MIVITLLAAIHVERMAPSSNYVRKYQNMGVIVVIIYRYNRDVETDGVDGTGYIEKKDYSRHK